MLQVIIGGAAFIILGLVFFLKPALVWKLTEQWKSYGADCPSELYIKSSKFGGVILVLLGIAMVSVSLLGWN